MGWPKSTGPGNPAEVRFLPAGPGNGRPVSRPRPKDRYFCDFVGHDHIPHRPVQLLLSVGVLSDQVGQRCFDQLVHRLDLVRGCFSGDRGASSQKQEHRDRPPSDRIRPLHKSSYHRYPTPPVIWWRFPRALSIRISQCWRITVRSPKLPTQESVLTRTSKPRFSPLGSGTVPE